MNAHFKPAVLLPTHGFAGLMAPHIAEVPTEPLSAPHWLAWNAPLAQSLGLPAQPNEAWLRILSGQLEHSPWCSVYSGHQFGVWAGQLGDGRAHTIGQLNAHGVPQEIQLKGAGKTPFSRMGDGRAVWRSSIREYLCSEAMAGLGIPTTRALAVVGSDLPVQRETLEQAAIVTRVAESFIRFGHFEHFAHHGHLAALQQLTDHVIARYYPECAEAPLPALALLDAVIRRTAMLMAQWQAVGFCHGVMNTDNMSILGLTLDYGPFGFMDAFDLHHVCNHSDGEGRYAYAQQPRIGWWNCGALGSALLPLIGDEMALREALARYEPAFQEALSAAFRSKLGLMGTRDDDEQLVGRLMQLLHQSRTDFTRFFRMLPAFTRVASAHDPVRDLVVDRVAYDGWATTYRERLAWEESEDEARRAAMQRVNPKFVLRNYLAETAIRAAREGNLEV
ncbi:MAG: YdiU family protein, partial [Ferrovum sp.]|nr:YdiU family protein [Ferrovum sp.]